MPWMVQQVHAVIAICLHTWILEDTLGTNWQDMMNRLFHVVVFMFTLL